MPGLLGAAVIDRVISRKQGQFKEVGRRKDMVGRGTFVTGTMLLTSGKSYLIIMK